MKKNKKITKNLYKIIILTLLVFYGLQAQTPERNLTLSGVVVDEDDIPQIGVNIYIKNSPGVGTVSDEEGAFEIQVAVAETVVFQMLGMASVEKVVTESEEDVTIILESDTELLDEIVVTGLASQKKVSIVGAISTVNVDNLKSPATSINNMHEGRVAEVITCLASQEPRQNISNFWIRGIGTYGAYPGALVLIDGLEGLLHDIVLDEVESFSILMDAAATAVYGVRGAYGV